MKAAIAVVVLVSSTSVSAVAQDWNQWRGASRDGTSEIFTPEPWPETLVRRYRIEVGSGHASPANVADRVFVFTRQGDEEIVRALNLDDGRQLWRAATRAPYEMHSAATGHGPGPKSSPLVDQDRVFTLGISGTLSAHRQDDGALVWQSAATGYPIYGHAMSPLLADGKLIVHLGRPGDGALSALDPESGEPLWRLEGDGPGYASPLAVTWGGNRQVVTQTDAHIIGVSLDDGRLLWRIPFTTPYDQNVVSPVVAGDRIVLSGLDQATFAIEWRVDEPEEVWRNPATFYMSTPVHLGGAVIGFSDKRSGHWVAMDAGTGETTWQGRPRQGENAALVAIGDRILTLTDNAELAVRRIVEGRLELERTYDVAETPTWAHPVPTGQGILIKELDHLSLWGVR